MKRFIIFMLLIFTINILISQNIDSLKQKKNGIYTEIYTIQHDFNGSFISFNYEHFFLKKRLHSLRFGIYPDYITSVSFPLTFTQITGPKKKNHLEYGIGAVFRLEFYQGNIYKDIPAVMIPIMYRFQKRKGFYFRAGANIFISWPTIISPSFSLGYRF